jgi:predicted dehydrogenase
MSKLRICIVGAGGWGEQHARACAARADVEIAGVFSRTRARAEARVAKYGGRAYDDLDAMIGREKPDLVMVSLPNREHFAPTLRLIELGCNLMVEKPLVFDPGEADRLVAEAARRKLFAAINFNHRYAQPIVLARAAISAGRIGTPVFATWRFGGEGGVCDRHDNLIETQCHGFDQLEDLCGPIASIMAQMRVDAVKGPSTLALALGFANGAVGALVGSYDASYAHPGTHRLEICGDAGRIVVEDTVRRFTCHRHGNEVGEVWEAGYFDDRARDFHHTMDRHLDAILAAFRAGQPPPIPIAAGARAVHLAHAAIRSWREGVRVTL